MRTKPRIINANMLEAAGESELHRIPYPDGISFKATTQYKQRGKRPPATIGVELCVRRRGRLLEITMRRTTTKRDAWYCTTSTIHLPPDAAADLAQAVSAKTNRQNSGKNRNHMKNDLKPAANSSGGDGPGVRLWRK